MRISDKRLRAGLPFLPEKFWSFSQHYRVASHSSGAQTELELRLVEGERGKGTVILMMRTFILREGGPKTLQKPVCILRLKVYRQLKGRRSEGGLEVEKFPILAFSLPLLGVTSEESAEECQVIDNHLL